MNLTQLFTTLSIPAESGAKRFNATPVEGFPHFRLAVDEVGQPVLLFDSNASGSRVRSFKLKYLELLGHVNCSVREDSVSFSATFTVITFTSPDTSLQEYFLRTAGVLVEALGPTPSATQIAESLSRFVELFRALSDMPTKSIQGLWAELLVIENCRDCATLLAYWHETPENKFDFDAGSEKIEVKSSSTFNRVHHFSSEQLNASLGVNILVASLFTKQIASGLNVMELIERIETKLQHHPDLCEKLHVITLRTLGDSLSEGMKVSFDYRLAKESLLFFAHNDIGKISASDIPLSVSDVRFRSDLADVPPIDPRTLESVGHLFQAI